MDALSLFIHYQSLYELQVTHGIAGTFLLDAGVAKQRADKSCLLVMWIMT